jgi:predicted ATPase
MHFERGHDVERAMHYRQQAAEQALWRYAYREAVAHLSTALELLQKLPETSAQHRQELQLQMSLGRAMMVTRGYGFPDVERIYTRALRLCQQLGDTTNYVVILEALCRFAINRATLRPALERGEELLALAQRAESVPRLLSAHQALGQTLYYLGEFTAARLHLERDTVALDATQHHAGAAGSDVAVQVYGLVFAAQTCWCLGYATQARRHSHDAVVLAQTLPQPQSLTIAYYYAARLAMCMQDVPLAQQYAEAAMALATEHGFGLWHATSLFIRGWALARQAQGEAGMEQMLQGITGAQQAGTTLHLPLYCTLCAEIYGQLGQIDAGLRMLAQASAIMTQTEMAYYAAEVSRVQGTLLLRQGLADVGQAEACLQQALAIAQRQQAKLFELRAAVSLSRLWQQQGKHTAAHALLAPVYGWFTEGFETADVQEAAVLLAALGRSHC